MGRGVAGEAVCQQQFLREKAKVHGEMSGASAPQHELETTRRSTEGRGLGSG